MIVNFSLSKIQVAKNKELKGNVEARNNVKITDILEQNVSSFAEKKGAVNVQFSYTVSYGEEFGMIAMEGKALYLVEDKEKKEMLDQWKKEKKVDQKHSQKILNHILQRCNIRALSLELEVGLPPHIPFPRVALKSQVAGEKKAS
jgi:Holliday junction resolvase-like predicted endonuclease